MSRPLSQSVLVGLRALSTEIDHLDQVAADRYGLSRTDLRALDLLGQGGPMAPTELAERLGFTTGGVTSVIDRLETAGYVRRTQDRTDRRRLVLERTEATTRRDQEVFGELIRTTLAAIDRCTDFELVAIKAFLDETRAITADHAASLAGGGAGPRDRRPAPRVLAEPIDHDR